MGTHTNRKSKKFRKIRKTRKTRSKRGGANTPADNALIEAIKTRNLEGVRTALDNGARINDAQEIGAFPIHKAVRIEGINTQNPRQPDIEIVKLLVERDVDLHKKEILDKTPLFEAVAWGTPEIVSYLLTTDAAQDINEDDGFLQAPRTWGPMAAERRLSNWQNAQQNSQLLENYIQEQEIQRLRREMSEEDKRNYNSFKKEVRKDVINKGEFNILPSPPPIIEEKTEKFSVMSLNPRPHKSITAIEKVFSRKDDVERKIRDDYLGGKIKTRKRKTRKGRK